MIINALKTNTERGKSNLAVRISDARVRLGLDQGQLAKEMGTINKAVISWETDVSRPSLPVIIKLCETLDITPNELLLGKS